MVAVESLTRMSAVYRLLQREGCLRQQNLDGSFVIQSIDDAVAESVFRAVLAEIAVLRYLLQRDEIIVDVSSDSWLRR